MAGKERVGGASKQAVRSNGSQGEVWQGRSQEGEVADCGVSGAGGSSSLPDKTNQVEGVGQDVTQVVGFGAVVEAEPGRALEMAAGLVGVATLGIALAADAQLPGGGIELEVAGEAQAAIGQLSASA